MVKRRAIEVSTQNMEDKLDSSGALRNVAVKDAWKRFRQKIEVQSWKEAETILKELADNLQKINLLKAVSSSINRLKANFQSPDEMVEDGDLPKETPREEKSRTLELANDLQKSLDDISKLEDCLRTVKQKMDGPSDLPTVSPPTHYTTSDVKSCYESLSVITEKYKKTSRDLDQSRTKVEALETKINDLETQLGDKYAQINHLTNAIETLEKKHNNMKEQKMDTFKDQMKFKSLERQVEAKDSELGKLKEEHSDLKHRFDSLVKSKTADIGEANNPFPPSKIGERYSELFKAERVAAVEFYKTSEEKNDREACNRVVELLQECYGFCERTSADQLEKLACYMIDPLHQRSGKAQEKLAAADLSTILNIRKSSCKLSAESVKNAFIAHLEETSDEKFTLSEITGCLSYIEKCVDLCWATLIQTTPLWIQFNATPSENSGINTEMFDVAEGKGKTLDFILWPPLLNGKDKNVLRKGQIRAK